MQRFDFFTEQIETCETQIAAQIDSLTPPDGGSDGDLSPGSPDASHPGRSASKPPPLGKHASRTARERAAAEALHRMMGVDLTAIPTIGVNTALTIASEIGPDFSAFPSAQHFCSWLGLAPGTRISGGKPLPGRAPKVVNKVAQYLRMAAMTARRSQTFIGARHRGRPARKDAPVAITATARELACLIYTPVTRDETIIVRYADDFVVGFQYKRDAERFLCDLKDRLADFSLDLHPDKTRLIEFGRFAMANRRAQGERRPETFDFLGFTHYCRTTRKGCFGLGRKPIGKRVNRTLKRIKAELRQWMHHNVYEVAIWLGRVVGGWLRYFAVPTSIRSLGKFVHRLKRLWGYAFCVASRRRIASNGARSNSWPGSSGLR